MLEIIVQLYKYFRILFSNNYLKTLAIVQPSLQDLLNKAHFCRRPLNLHAIIYAKQGVVLLTCIVIFFPLNIQLLDSYQDGVSNRLATSVLQIQRADNVYTKLYNLTCAESFLNDNLKL